MFLRWIHSAWKYFWMTVLILFLFLVIAGGGLFGLLQLDTSKNYIADRIEREFNGRFGGELTIGDLQGLIPFRFELDDVVLRSADPLETEPVVTIDRLNTQIDLWGLFQNKLRIIDFHLEQPSVRLQSDDEGRYSLSTALQPQTDAPFPGRLPIEEIEILAPSMTILNGALFIDRFHGIGGGVHLPEPFTVHSLNIAMFIEISADQRFFDFESFSAVLPGLNMNRVEFSGQVYNDSRYLEFNSFNINTPGSELTVSGQIDGIDVRTGLAGLQFPEAHYNLDFNSNMMRLSEFVDLVPGIPNINEPLDFAIQAEGDADSLWIDRFDFGVGESFVSIDGLFRNVDRRADFNYEFHVRNVTMRKQDVEVFTGPLEQAQFALMENLRFDGISSGTADSIHVELNMESPEGMVGLAGYTRLRAPYRYSASLSASEVNLSSISENRLDSTRLNFEAQVGGTGFDFLTNLHTVTASFHDSSVDEIHVDLLNVNATLQDGFLEHRYTYSRGEEWLNGNGTVDFTAEETRFALRGEAANVDLAAFFGPLPGTNLNLNYNVELQGLRPDRIQGRANLDIAPSRIGSDTVRAHQIYMDLDSPDLGTRNFRLTSTLFDMNLSGNLVPSNMHRQARYWTGYFSDRIREEVFLDSPTAEDATGNVAANELAPLEITGTLETKDLSLVHNYWETFPDIVSDSRFDFEVRADSTRLLLSANSFADTLNINTTETRGVTARLTATFRHDRLLREFSSIDFDTRIDSVHNSYLDLGSLHFDLALRQDSLVLTNTIANISNEANFRLSLESSLSDSLIRVDFRDFFLGNEIYGWQNRSTPSLAIYRSGEIEFNDFRFQNDDEFLELRGRIAENRSDSLHLDIRDVSLERISSLVNGRHSFAGIMNGTLSIQSLVSNPSIQGSVTVQRLSINGRPLGDAAFSSRFNQDQNRFDTQISVITDSTRFADYLAENDNTGQDLYLDGYFIPPGQAAGRDTLFYFDADFNEIDLWIVPLIAPDVFDVVEGRANGRGYITGNLDDYDFHFDFQVENAFAKPGFLNTNYFLNGRVVFDRQDWVVLDSLQISDTKGGRGMVFGSVDLNNFSPLTNLDLTFDLDRLHILNNTYNPDVPFYGSLSGSGRVRLSGPNSDLFLQTLSPLELTPDSKLSIPLLEQTEFNENTKFIQFVDTFDPETSPDEPVQTGNGSQADRETLNRILQNMTFSERFNLDLQFNASEPMTVELVFDQVTGEILTAEGTGQVRFTMQEEDIGLFGRFNITSGRYIFVGGEIFTRPLDLESGGSIVWEGEPDNARLNINAVYHARPNIAPLNAEANGAGEQADLDGQRVPIDLVLEITGTISSVENNYYFRIPGTFDISSNVSLTTIVNDLNRNEQEKLIQATSLLLTGNFVSFQNTNEAYGNIGQSFTRRSTYLNPLISSQVISPLLSNQINALLNSDVSRFDINFSLNAYNEIDLGVALRLYNDRLILRREGLITGSGFDDQTTLTERIGDLNATYRINNSLSVMAFHRQDQSLGNFAVASNTGSTVDGIGLEAQVQFNTWKEFTAGIRRTILGIFGSDGREEENESENEEGDALASDDEL